MGLIAILIQKEENMGKITKRTQGVMEFVQTIFIDEMKQIIDEQGASFLKFLILLQGIEFLGSCYDDLPFSKRGQSEIRFNRGLEKLGEIYIKYTQKGHHQYFYDFFRNPMIHQFKHDQSKITLATQNSVWYEELHLTLNREGRLYVVLESFYEDIRRAAIDLIDKVESGELKINKLGDPYLTITTIGDLQIQSS